MDVLSRSTTDLYHAGRARGIARSYGERKRERREVGMGSRARGNTEPKREIFIRDPLKRHREDRLLKKIGRRRASERNEREERNKKVM
jgi:hypothetical protein